MSFIAEFKRVQGEVKKTNVQKGFNTIDVSIDTLTATYGVPEYLVLAIKQARIAQKLMLVVSELGEALESLRRDDPPDSHIPEFSGVEAEMADAIIRLMNLSTDGNFRLADAIIAKAAYNAGRPYQHGGKKF